LRSLLAFDEAVVAIAEGMGPRWAQACVLVLSDNGYLLGDHDHVGKTIWLDEAVRVPMLARCPGLTPGADNRLAASIDIASTILHAAGLRVPTNMDGRTLHDAWNRDGVLVENWAEYPFVGVKTRDALYVVPKGEAPALYMLADGEARDHLTPGEAARWAARLDALSGCTGQACRDADGGG
jgi:N-acetylglucosamine-6-sulfatase